MSISVPSAASAPAATQLAGSRCSDGCRCNGLTRRSPWAPVEVEVEEVEEEEEEEEKKEETEEKGNNNEAE